MCFLNNQCNHAFLFLQAHSVQSTKTNRNFWFSHSQMLPGCFINNRFIAGWFTTVGSSCGRFITGQFIAGWFITKHDKQFFVGAVLASFVIGGHMMFVSLTCAFLQKMKNADGTTVTLQSITKKKKRTDKS